jgi:hypothetical protein
MATISFSEALYNPGDEPKPICSMGEYSKKGKIETIFDNANANACLIVAAPDLLEALQYAYQKLHNFVVVHGDDVLGEAWTTGEAKILAALAKAEKETI